VVRAATTPPPPKKADAADRLGALGLDTPIPPFDAEHHPAPGARSGRLSRTPGVDCALSG
jgi:hypothetical protein